MSSSHGFTCNKGNCPWELGGWVLGMCAVEFPLEGCEFSLTRW